MRFLYLNTENIYPQDRHLIDGMRELGHEIVEICEKGPGVARRIETRIKSETKPYDAVFVGFTSPLYVFMARRAGAKQVIFNAELPQYEANIVSRQDYGLLGARTIKWWILDFLSFYKSDKILLESKAQIDYVSKKFFVSKNKLILSYSGLDEKEFFFDPSVPKAKDFTVLFRGRFLPESGILTVIESAKKLENSGIKFLIIGHGFMYREVNALMAKLSPKNITMMTERLPIGELRRLMLSSHISLGQLADHPRLNRTLPCKLFESLALKLPYLTGRNNAVFEVLKENETCIASNPGDSDDLAEKILYLRDNPALREKISTCGYELYKEKLSSQKLAEEVIKNI